MTKSEQTLGTEIPSVCAHRGDSSRYRENTIPAIMSALSCGADFVEVDVRLTSDGKVIVLHDATLERIWGIKRSVSEMTSVEIDNIRQGIHHIPSLAEVLRLFVNSESTLLIDMDSAEPAAAAYEVASQNGRSVAWCGDLEGMQLIRSLDADARIWMPWNLPHAPTTADTEALAPEFINSNLQYVTRGFVQDVHTLGHKVAVWTVDDEPSMLRMLGAEVDSVTTNRMADLQRVIQDGKTTLPVLQGD